MRVPAFSVALSVADSLKYGCSPRLGEPRRLLDPRRRDGGPLAAAVSGMWAVAVPPRWEQLLAGRSRSLRSSRLPLVRRRPEDVRTAHGTGGDVDLDARIWRGVSSWRMSRRSALPRIPTLLTISQKKGKALPYVSRISNGVSEVRASYAHGGS
jgi:hypothetical protein